MTAPKMMFASGARGRRDDLGGLVDLEQAEVAAAGDREQHALAPSIDDSSSGLEMAAFAASCARLSPVARPMPMSAEPASAMIVRTSAKSRLIRPGTVMRSVMPCVPWRRTSSAMRNASRIDVFFSATCSRRSFGMTMSVSTMLAKALDAVVGLQRALAALERERPRDDADGQRADLLLGDLGDDGRGTGSGAAALARGDEDHVGALERLLDLGAVLLGGLEARRRGRRRRRDPWSGSRRCGPCSRRRT